VKRAVVTGAFSNIGSAAARHLLRRDYELHTLTNRRRPPGTDNISTGALTFDPEHLTREIDGADVLVSTYWIRLPHSGTTFATAVRNLKTLIDAAVRAGVGRFVHVSVSNASLDSGLGYYRGKAEVDEALRRSGLSHAIVRPTLVVGPHDILSGNIAWFLRRFPVFPVPGGGRYRLQPVTLEETGRIIADAAEEKADLDIDAAGPEVYTFMEYVELLARACGVRRLIIGTPGALSLAATRIVGTFLGDIVLTREELLGLQQELLLSRKPATGAESAKAWLLEHGRDLGHEYINDLHLHFGGGSSTPISRPEGVTVRGSP